jgi:hypothetical protein
MFFVRLATDRVSATDYSPGISVFEQDTQRIVPLQERDGHHLNRVNPLTSRRSRPS